MRKFHLTKQETASLCDALGYLLEAGFAHSEALLLLAGEEKEPRLQKKLEVMAELTDGGAPLHKAFARADCFDGYVCRLLEVGEQVGKTAQTLSELAGFYRRRWAMEERLRSALTYPAALLVVLLGVVCVLLVWVMPIFQEVYQGLGSSLTGLAGYLLAFGRGLGKALPWLGLGLVLFAMVLAVPTVRSRVKKHFADRGVWKDINSARYLQALSLGLSCGMEETEAAALASRLAEGSFARRSAAFVQRLSRGESLGAALAEEGFLSPAHRRLLEAAKRSGHGDQALQTIAIDAARCSEEALEGRLGRAEPIMVVVACGLVAGVLASVMVPLVSIMNTLG